MGNTYHTTVLLQETIDALNIATGKKYIDATLGGGGHTGRIIEQGGIVLGIDADEDALNFVRINFKFQISNFKLRLARGNFKDIDKISSENGFEEVAGILFDLGVSSHQLEKAERGFSFQKDGPLDMRMDQSLNVKAWDLVNSLRKAELTELFTKFGEEGFARQIAEAIVTERKNEPIITTLQLVEIVRKVVTRGNKDINPATKVFQALRMAINDEQNVLREALPKAFEILEKGGRLAVISFHSLEDRIVKYQLKAWEESDKGKIVTKKPITPSVLEVNENKRSRSSKLRVIEKI